MSLNSVDRLGTCGTCRVSPTQEDRGGSGIFAVFRYDVSGVADWFQFRGYLFDLGANLGGSVMVFLSSSIISSFDTSSSDAGYLDDLIVTGLIGFVSYPIFLLRIEPWELV